MPPMPPALQEMLLRARMQQGQRPPMLQGPQAPPQQGGLAAAMKALQYLASRSQAAQTDRRGEAAKPAAKSPVKGKAQAGKKAPASKKKGGK